MNLPNTEKAHQFFQRSRIAVKRLSLFSAIAASLAMGLGAARLFGINYTFAPFAVIVLTVLIILTNHLRQQASQFSQQCRRLSIRALALEQDIDDARIGIITADEPFASRHLSKSSAAPLNFNDYYDVSQPPGYRRLREAYAHSAFFTWKVSSDYSRVLFAATLVSLLALLAILYQLAISPAPSIPRQIETVDTLYSVIFVYLLTAMVDALFRTSAAAANFRDISLSLLDSGPMSDQFVEEMTREYDIARADGRENPTWLFRLRNKRLSEDWNLRKKALESSESGAAPE